MITDSLLERTDCLIVLVATLYSGERARLTAYQKPIRDKQRFFSHFDGSSFFSSSFAETIP